LPRKVLYLLEAAAVLRIAERLTEAHGLFLYKRDEGGFTGWVAKRLKMSHETAYRLLRVNEKLGESFNHVETLPRSVLYLLAAPSTPEEVRQDAVERVEAGGRLSFAKTFTSGLAGQSLQQLQTLPREVLYLLATLAASRRRAENRAKR
jgi:hypothetical protein